MPNYGTEKNKVTDGDILQLISILIIILVVLWYGCTGAKANEVVITETESFNIIAEELPIEYVTQEAYDLLEDELIIEKNYRTALEHKLFLQENSNRVLRQELATAKEGWKQAKYQWDFWKYKATEL